MSKLIFKQALVIFVMSTVYVIISVLSPSILTGKQGVLYYLIKDYTNKECDLNCADSCLKSPKTNTSEALFKECILQECNCVYLGTKDHFELNNYTSLMSILVISILVYFMIRKLINFIKNKSEDLQNSLEYCLLN